ncbi:hypothetical protein DFH09DRAFT_1414883 [Mycena vulgaris]|nr:hypothetical protein DFH09DRAFT_1414883 [Mycena vulgaris]
MADVDDKFMYDARHGRCYGLEDAIGAAHHLKLDTLAGPQARDVRKWALLVDECLKAFPALNDFTGRWPRRRQKGERGAGAGARAVSGSKAPRTDLTPDDSPASGTQEPNSKKRKEHPDPGRGEKENVSVDDSVWSTNRTQTPAALHNRIAPKWALTQPVERCDGEETSSTARREDDGCPTSQLCPLPSWAVKSVSSNQIAGNTTEVSLPPVAFNHAEISSTAPREGAIARNTAAPLAPSGRGERSSTAGREDSFSSREGSSKMFTPTEPQTKPHERRNNSTTRREDVHFPSSQGASNTSASASSPLFLTGRSEESSTALRENQSAKPRVISTTCVFCGFQPPIPSEQTTELQLFFNGRDDLHQVFTVIGGVADHHLRALFHLGIKKREALLRGLTPEYVTYVEKIEIADMLETHAGKSCICAAKVQLTVIPRPPEGLENMLLKYTCTHALVKKQMHIADDEEYFEIVELIEAELPRHLDRAKPVDEPDDAQIGELVKSVRIICWLAMSCR